ncbi:MAG: hypothetical protein ACOX60_08970 [Massiliimalia sp.]
MKLFGSHIEPSCSYCKSGKKTSDKQMVLCNRYGVVAPYYSCRWFRYAPLKRVPRRHQVLPEYQKEDFSLD